MIKAKKTSEKRFVCVAIHVKLFSFRSLCVFCLLTLSMSANPNEHEYQVKAAYLYNLTKFVVWPEFDHETFDICLLGTDPFGRYIQSIEQKKVAGRPIRLIRLMQFDASKQCRILFIGGSAYHQFDQADYPEGMLTISDRENFIDQGGMLALVVSEQKVRVKINQDALKQKKLKVSAKLLEVADCQGGLDD